PREAKLAQAHDCGRSERVGLLWLAAGCVLLGIFPVNVLALLDAVSQSLLGASLGPHLQQWWLLAPIERGRASYSPVVFMLGTLVLVALTMIAVRAFYHGRVRRAPAWACGFPWLTPRMQDTAEGFGQPIRQIFEPFFRIQRELPSAFDVSPHYRVQVEDHVWYGLYTPVAAVVQAGARLVSRIQQGSIAVYLLYSFVTLVALLVFVL
ncbi:MAG TPA: hydrogenase 4 subunit B, partial [Candidatus Eisenbacteria bacterium]|nr:hydrogenase 4 subunit B [Candidatus Eisenbacteria bacterium]